MPLGLSFCFKIALAIRGLHVFCMCVCVCVVPYELQDYLFYICGKCCWNFDRYCTKSLHQAKKFLHSKGNH